MHFWNEWMLLREPIQRWGFGNSNKLWGYVWNYWGGGDPYRMNHINSTLAWGNQMLDLQAILGKIYSNLPAIIRNLTCSIPSKWWRSLYWIPLGSGFSLLSRESIQLWEDKCEKFFLQYTHGAKACLPVVFFLLLLPMARERRKKLV